MSYVVLARKWRPQSFEDLVGQEHVSTTIANAIQRGRVAHAFLFTGVRGVGKTTSARILAKALNCQNGPTPTPCQKCPACVEITNGNDVDVQEIDGASYTGVDDVRKLQESLPYRPQRDRFKIFIVDEVHMLSVNAWNAFLKTLEEPPPHVKFIFATTEVHKVPVTILSRCQRYDFKLISAQTIAGRLKFVLGQENIAAEDAAIATIAREAAGSMRDAMSLLDQVIAWVGTSGDKLTAEGVAKVLGVADRQVLHRLSGALVDGDPAACVRIVGELAQEGYDIPHVAKSILAQLRDLVVAKVCDEPDKLLDLAQEEIADVKALASRAEADDLVRLHQGFSRAFDDIVRGGQPRASLEMALIRLARRPPLVPVDELLRRLSDLERRLGGGGGAPPGAGGAGAGRGGPPARGGGSGARASFDAPKAGPAGAAASFDAPSAVRNGASAAGAMPSGAGGMASGAGGMASAAAATDVAAGEMAPGRHGSANAAGEMPPRRHGGAIPEGATASPSGAEARPQAAMSPPAAAEAISAAPVSSPARGDASSAAGMSQSGRRDASPAAGMSQSGRGDVGPAPGMAPSSRREGAAVSPPPARPQFEAPPMSAPRFTPPSGPVLRPSSPPPPLDGASGPPSRPTPPPKPQEIVARPQPQAPTRPASDAEITTWRAILDTIRQRRPALASVLAHAQIFDMRPERVTLAYEQTSFLFAQASEGSAKELLTSAVRAYFGAQTEVVLEIAVGQTGTTVADLDTKDRKAKQEAARREVAEHPLVVAAIRTLGAELIDVRLAEAPDA
jgi:DNA polymerase-3 subunit gamma/tau